MSNYVIQDTSLVNIANAIRSKTGESALLTPAEMVAAINSITTGGSSSSGGWILRKEFYETSTVSGEAAEIIHGSYIDIDTELAQDKAFLFLFTSTSKGASSNAPADHVYLLFYDGSKLVSTNSYYTAGNKLAQALIPIANDYDYSFEVNYDSSTQTNVIRINNNETSGSYDVDLYKNAGYKVSGKYVWGNIFYLDESFNEIGEMNIPYLYQWNYQGKNNAIIEKLYDKLTFEVQDGTFTSAFAQDNAVESNGVSDWRDKTILLKRTPLSDIRFDDMYRNNNTIKYPPKIAVAPNATIASDAAIVVQTMFRNSHIVKLSNDNVLQTFPLYTYSTPQQEMCCNCYYLREVPENFMIPVLKLSRSLPPVAQRAITTSMYKNCYVLKEIRGMCYHLNAASSNSVNLFGNTFNNCYTLHSLTFFTENDSDFYSAGNNTIDLSTVGYWESGTADADIFQYLEDDDKANAIVIRDASNATVANMKNTNSFAVGAAYATYNRQSAIETINTLPNASGNSQTGTIKFKSGAGSAYGTDYNMSNLSAEEIAVATAKGWTVALV